jgi:transcription-repair coupling factor (superfamily II helicase)
LITKAQKKLDDQKAKIDDLQAETVDRFGALPEPARQLFRIARLRVVATRCGVERFDIGVGSGSVTFVDDPPVDTGALILFVQRHGKTMRFDGPKKVRFGGAWKETEERFAAAQSLLDGLAQCVLEKM